ncbi:hypothetical protein F511_38810 [Dorcoceras hygrometricum]|uniref:Uncharacterized protein n=1 Tax=Dorcoceras hygrometricum TaxID=472368 RepID=A0A2Z7BSW1_9LAMI|nr:hypothetical protein F511_38810 [Dorcoceras hygrometricum]
MGKATQIPFIFSHDLWLGNSTLGRVHLIKFLLISALALAHGEGATDIWTAAHPSMVTVRLPELIAEMKQTRRSGTILGNKPDLYCSPLSLKRISCWTNQTSSKVTVEQSAVGIYKSVTRHWNQSQDTRNTLTLKPAAVNSALLDSNKEGYLLVSNGEGYLLVSHKEST